MKHVFLKFVTLLLIFTFVVSIAPSSAYAEENYLDIYVHDEYIIGEKGTVECYSNGMEPTYKSSNTSVLKFVDKEGNFKCLKKGTAEITVKAGNITQKKKIVVCEPYISVGNGGVNTSVQLQKDQSYFVFILDGTSKDYDVEKDIKISDKKIVTIGKDGKLKALKKGKATITCKTNKKIRSLNVEVIDPISVVVTKYTGVKKNGEWYANATVSNKSNKDIYLYGLSQEEAWGEGGGFAEYYFNKPVLLKAKANKTVSVKIGSGYNYVFKVGNNIDSVGVLCRYQNDGFWSTFTYDKKTKSYKKFWTDYWFRYEMYHKFDAKKQ